LTSLASAVSICSEKDSDSQIVEVRKVFKDELSKCGTPREVQKLIATAERVINAASSDSFGVSGRVAYRLREAMRSLRSSNFAALGCHHKLPIQKALNREAARRKAELQRAGGGGVMTLPPLLGTMIKEETPPPSAAGDGLERTLLPRLAGADLAAAIAAVSAADEAGAAAGAGAEARGEESRKSLGTSDEAAAVLGRSVTDLEEKMDKSGPSATEKLWKSAFRKFKDDGQVHRDSLLQVLAFIGYPNADQTIIQDAFEEVSEGYSTLAEEELIVFINTYLRRLDKKIDAAFRQYDADNSGSISREELQELLAAFGIEPLKHVLEEILDECDSDGSGVLDLVEFKTVMQIIREREGFTKGEYDCFMELFARCDNDGSGEIASEELDALLTWLGYAMEKEHTTTIMRQVDVDNNGTLSSEEFLICMRKVREHEMTKIHTVFVNADSDGSGTISRTELPAAVQTLGYVPDAEAVWEAAAEAHIAEDQTDLDFGELWRLLTIYRAREGFLKSESDEIASAFGRFDKEKNGEIGVLDVGRVLRWLGYPASFELVQQLVAQVDIDGSGRLSLPELRKFVRMYQGRELAQARKAFNDYDTRRVEALTCNECQKALKSIDCVDARGLAVEPAPHDLLPAPTSIDGPCDPASQSYIDWEGFIRTAMVCKRRLRQAFRDNGGFSAQEVVDLRKKFNKYDRDGSGDIGNRELALLLEDCFPQIAHDPAKRPIVKKLVSDLDDNGSGSLDFREFVQFMDKFRELEQQERIERERNAIDATTFSTKEAEEFREHFLTASGGVPDLTIGCLLNLLRRIMPLGDRNMAELNKHIRDVVQSDGRAVEQVDFPEFLLLMHRLLEANFAGIKTGVNTAKN